MQRAVRNLLIKSFLSVRKLPIKYSLHHFYWRCIEFECEVFRGKLDTRRKCRNVLAREFIANLHNRTEAFVKRRICMQMSYFCRKRERDFASLLAVALKKIGRIRSKLSLRYIYGEISVFRLAPRTMLHAAVWDLDTNARTLFKVATWNLQ